MNAYDDYSRQALLDEINKLKQTVELLKEEIDQTKQFQYSWVGYLGNWHWDLEDNTVFVNRGQSGRPPEEMALPKKYDLTYYTDKICPEFIHDVEKKMTAHLLEETPVYEAKYPVKTDDNKWVWYYDRAMVTKRDQDGQPLVVSGIIFDVTKDKEKELLLTEKNSELRSLLQTDHLTGMSNRSAILSCLHNEMDKAKQFGTTLGLVLFDVDDFKVINDTHGHLAGDDVLILISNTVKRFLSPRDSVGRFGGEEFLIIMPNRSPDDCFALINQIRQEVENMTQKTDCQTTISCGLSMHQDANLDMYTFIDQADQAMYNAKRLGKNNVVRFESL